MSRSKGWWRLFKRRSSFCHAGWGLFWILWKGGASAAGAFRAVERFRSLGAFSSTEAALTANVSGALPAAPPTPPAPGQQNRRLCRFPRLHFLASGRQGYGILPFPTSSPHPCGDDLARQFRLGDFDAGPSPQLSDFYVLQDGFCRCEITPPIHAFLFIFPYS